MPYFHLNSTTLAPGSVIEPGNWGRMVRAFGTQHGRWLAESAMEDVRRSEFPTVPSRLTSAFFFDAEAEARFYRDFYQLTPMLLYEVTLTAPNATQHRADYRANMPDNNLNLDWCRYYWNGHKMGQHMSGSRCEELLAETGLRIVRLIP